ncbi:hypothetical protein QLQ12_45615 [Actinoplanes sp. NEAU-A12]|uniref:UspA domain-containing protein n=1 Tax=Actinoplanes sandaracinus TaxID=3045177 RepID=A0ABT6X1U2_9ACTN|nr:hypothetical protein [Actinoplanes sandaracinus]MDI6105874.1 hypothetical protein [Actinoplanes sandaracinus]
MAARIVVGVVGTAPAEQALRHAFAEAERRGWAVTVVAAGPATEPEDLLIQDLIRRWADKHHAVESTLPVCRTVDAVVTLAAASRDADALVVQGGTDVRSAAMIAALARRAHCPLVITGDESADDSPAPGRRDQAGEHVRPGR